MMSKLVDLAVSWKSRWPLEHVIAAKAVGFGRLSIWFIII